MKGCKCIEELNKQLEEDPRRAKLDVSFNMVGDVYPAMYASYTKPGQKKTRTIPIIPNFCPFCGKPYSEGGVR